MAPEGFLNRVIAAISVALRETTLTISDSNDKTISLESETVKVVSLSTMEISEITWLQIRFLGSRYLNPLPNDKFLDVTKLKAFADDNFNVAKIVIYL